MIPVNKVYEYLEMMRRDKWGYIYGTAGVMWTQSAQNDLKARKSEDDKNYGNSVKYGAKWIGHMVTDCSGVMPYIWKQFGLKIPHGSTSMINGGYILDLGSIPHPGWACLTINNHIGIVGADGITVYEAMGAQNGFVTSKVTDSKWKKFGRFRDVDYTGSEVVPPVEPVSETYYATITGQGVRLRSGPGTTYSKVGDTNLNKGDVVKVLADCGNWKFCRVEKDNRQGYVYSQYVSAPIEHKTDEDTPDTKVDEYVMIKREDFERLYKALETVKEFTDKYKSCMIGG